LFKENGSPKVYGLEKLSSKGRSRNQQQGGEKNCVVILAIRGEPGHSKASFSTFM